jgi:hypothetical protein
MMMTEMDIETSVYYVHLTRLIAREDFIKFTRRESTKTYITDHTLEERPHPRKIKKKILLNLFLKKVKGITIIIIERLVYWIQDMKYIQIIISMKAVGTSERCCHNLYTTPRHIPEDLDLEYL